MNENEHVDPGAELGNRVLYVSLSGVERAEWKRNLAALGAGVFAVGLFLGAVIGRASAGGGQRWQRV